MSNVHTINGAKVNIDTQAGGLVADLWGLKEDDQNTRRNGASHLSGVSGDGFSYNLQTEDGCQAFIADLADGRLDGSAGASDGSVVVANGKVYVGGGEVPYNLLDPAGYAKLRQDNADGKLDGRITRDDGGGSATSPGSTNGGPSATPSQSGGSGASAPSSTPAGTGGAATPASDAANDVNAAIASVAHLSASELMSMMMNGKLPNEVANNPAAMNAIQMRIQEYMRMIQMMSDLMKMQHDMLMGIARNLK
jgi:hypothetical protein